MIEKNEMDAPRLSAAMAETIESLLTDLSDAHDLFEEEASVCDAAVRAAWVRAAHVTLTALLEKRDQKLFKILPHLAQARTDRLYYHEYNMDEYRRQIDRFCSYLTTHQAKKYALSYET